MEDITPACGLEFPSNPNNPFLNLFVCVLIFFFFAVPSLCLLLEIIFYHIKINHLQKTIAIKIERTTAQKERKKKWQTLWRNLYPSGLLSLTQISKFYTVNLTGLINSNVLLSFVEFCSKFRRRKKSRVELYMEIE